MLFYASRPSSTSDQTAANKESVISYNLINPSDYRTPDNNYACPVCSKICTQLNTFKNHYLIHTGEKPHGCPYCSYRCNHISNLYRHCKIKHSVNLAQQLSNKSYTFTDRDIN